MRMGHSDHQMTPRYAHLEPEHKAAVATLVAEPAPQSAAQDSASAEFEK